MCDQINIFHKKQKETLALRIKNTRSIRNLAKQRTTLALMCKHVRFTLARFDSNLVQTCVEICIIGIWTLGMDPMLRSG